MATRVRRTTDKSTRRIDRLERDLREARRMIAELQASIIFLNALSERPVDCLTAGIVEATEPVAVGGGTVVDAQVIQFQPRPATGGAEGDAQVIAFRPRG